MRSELTGSVPRRVTGVILTALILGAGVILSGCLGRFFLTSSPEPARFGPGNLTVYELRSAVRDVADETTDLIADAVQRLIEAGVTPEGRRLANQIRLEFGLNATINASAPNPLVGLIDMAVMTRLSRIAIETHPTVTIGEHADIALDAVRRAEARVWSLAERALTPTQLADVSNAIERWKSESVAMSYITGVRLADFAELRLVSKEATRQTGLPQSLLEILAIDPLAGLDPATREIEQSRMLAERAMFQLQRAPRLLRWEIESLFDAIAITHEAQSTVESIERASRSADQLVVRIGEIPDQILDGQSTLLTELQQAVIEERAATISAITEMIEGQREALRTDLTHIEQPLASTLDRVQRTSDGLTILAQELTLLVRASDALSERFGVGKGEPAPPRTADASEASLLDATADFASIARDLRASIDALAGILDTASPDAPDAVRSILGEAEASATSLADALFWRGAALIGLFGVVLFLALAAARWIPRRAPAH